MKRFITYLYVYRNGVRIKNTGHLRVDIRNQKVTIQACIKDVQLEQETGTFFIIVRAQEVYGIPLEEIRMKDGVCNRVLSCMYTTIQETEYSMQQAIGIGIRFENGYYMASSWKDEEDEVVAKGEFHIYGEHIESNIETTVALPEEYSGEEDESKEYSADISVVETFTEEQQETIYRKLNLNEIYTLPSRHWHYSNNSFLIHGFWNYGYLVLKEDMEADQKKYYLGVPGIFEQPEMVMAMYFGFSNFETIPPQMETMEIGQSCKVPGQIRNQHPQSGTFGCWFVHL